MKRLIYIIISSFLVLFAYPLLAEEQDEVSVFSNEAQVQKAETLSEISQEQAHQEALETQENIENTEKELESAQENLNKLEQDPTSTVNEIIDARLAVDEALEKLNEETQHLADISSSTVEDIAQMRADGIGWGDIAHELGIHPSNLGLGHGKKDARERGSKSYEEVASNSKNSNSGKSIGLSGKSSFSSNNGNKGGNSFGEKGNSSNKGGNSSNDQGNGSSNGNGNGNGGGNGNGKN